MPANPVIARPLLTAGTAEASLAELAAISERTGVTIEPRLFPESGSLSAAERLEIEIAYASPDLVRMGAFRQFFGLIEKLPNLQWLHLGFAGIDNPFFGTLLNRGVRLSNSPGAAAEPIAHTAMAGPALARTAAASLPGNATRSSLGSPAGRRSPKRPEQPDARDLRPRRHRR